MFTKQFWIDVAVRAIKTGAQAAVAVVGVGATGIFDWDFVALASVIGAAIVASVLTSIASLDSVGAAAVEPRHAADDAAPEGAEDDSDVLPDDPAGIDEGNLMDNEAVSA